MKVKVKREDLKKGLRVIDDESNSGTILNCEDLHNVHVVLDGDGLDVTLENGEDIKCGGSSLYCFSEFCEKNDEFDYPLFKLEDDEKN